MLAALLVLAAQLPGETADPTAAHVVVVLDDSGSMDEPMPGAGGTKLDAAKTALLKVLAGLPPDARAGVFALNTRGRGGGYDVLPIGPLGRSGNRDVGEAIGSIRAWGGTPLGERLEQAAAALAAERDARKYGSYRLLIVTDGEATDAALLEEAVPRALAEGFTLDVIGVAMSGQHTLATQVDSYRRADDPASLSRALEEVLAESGGDGSGGGGADVSEDYDVLAPLPDGAAEVLIAALAAPADPSPADEGANAAEPGRVEPPNFPAQPLPPPPNAAGEVGGALGGLCCCLGPPALVLAVAGLIGYSLYNNNNNRRRR